MGKYTEIWRRELAFIKDAILKGEGSMQLNESAFKVVGNRDSAGYGIRIDIDDASVPKKSGSAVARNLKGVLDEDTVFKSLAKGKSVLIRMGKDFKLEISVSKLNKD